MSLSKVSGLLPPLLLRNSDWLIAYWGNLYRRQLERSHISHKLIRFSYHGTYPQWVRLICATKRLPAKYAEYMRIVTDHSLRVWRKRKLNILFVCITGTGGWYLWHVPHFFVEWSCITCYHQNSMSESKYIIWLFQPDSAHLISDLW